MNLPIEPRVVAFYQRKILLGLLTATVVGKSTLLGLQTNAVGLASLLVLTTTTAWRLLGLVLLPGLLNRFLLLLLLVLPALLSNILQLLQQEALLLFKLLHVIVLRSG